MENTRYEGQMKQADGVGSLVGDSFDSWSTSVISDFGVLDLSSCNLTVFVFTVLANTESGAEKLN